MAEFDSRDFESFIRRAFKKTDLESTYFVSIIRLTKNDHTKKQYVRFLNDKFWNLEGGMSNGGFLAVLGQFGSSAIKIGDPILSNKWFPRDRR